MINIQPILDLLQARVFHSQTLRLNKAKPTGCWLGVVGKAAERPATWSLRVDESVCRPAVRARQRRLGL